MNDASFYRYKKILRCLWVLLTISFLGLYFYYADQVTVNNLILFLGENRTTVLIAYILLSSIRSLFLLPSTPFVILGLGLYPNSPLFVFFMSLIGIQIGASIMYFASSYLTPSTLFGSKSEKINIIKTKMEKYGSWIIMGWALFPIVPTDLICFVSGSINYNFKKFFFAILLGEALLIAGYIFIGNSIIS